MTEKTTFIPARLKSSVVGGHVAGAADIIDDVKGKTQDTINEEVDNSLSEIRGAAGDLADTVEQNKQEANAEFQRIKGGSNKSIKDLSDEIATKQDNLTFDNAPALGSNNPVKSDGIKKALNEKQDTLEFENLPSDGSTKIVRSGGIKSYVDGKVNEEKQRAESAEQTNANAISTEKTRAEGAEHQLQDNIDAVAGNLSAEIQRSTQKDTQHDNAINTINQNAQTLDDKIDAETLRATGAEGALDTKIETTKSDLAAEVTRSTNKDTEHDTKLNTLNTNLAAEVTRATGKENEIISSVASEETRAKAAEQQNAGGIADINSKIPSEASSQNQLADKNFVNSSVGTNTANYISNGGEPFGSFAELEAYSGQKTNNDYAFVRTTDAAGNTVFKRYKYNASTNTWALEYELNNSSFTSQQWEAINSGITLLLKNKLAALPTYDELVALLAQKQNVIDDLQTIRSNAQTGAAAYHKPAAGIPSEDMTPEVQQSLSKADTALQQHQSLDNYYTKGQADNLLNGKQDNIADLSTIRDGASKGATALQEHQSLSDYYNKSQVDSKLAQKQDTLTIDQTPTVNSGNPISSDAVYDLQQALTDALNTKQAALTFDNMPTAGSGNPVTSGGVHAAIANSSQIRFVEVENLPEPSEETLSKIYVIKESATSYQWYVTVYDQELVPAAYVWRLVNNNSVDLSNYYTIAQVDALLAALATVATTGDFSDLQNIPTTLAGYGITDVKIEGGVITIGNATITPLTQHQDISGKADKSEMSITPGTGTDADKTTIQLKDGMSTTVLTQHQDISGKQDVLTFATDAECKSAANELT